MVDGEVVRGWDCRWELRPVWVTVSEVDSYTHSRVSFRSSWKTLLDRKTACGGDSGGGCIHEDPCHDRRSQDLLIGGGRDTSCM